MITEYSTKEDWRLVPEHPDYWVSSHGRVFSCRGPGEPKELRGGHNQRGYRLVQMRRPGGGITARTVHRLVALAFLGPPPDGMQIRHLDGDKENNAVGNLAYGTASENMLDQVAHGRHYFASRTHCPRQHPYDEENTRLYRGRRYCRACVSARRATGIEVAA